MGDFEGLALGVGTLMIAGAIANKIENNPRRSSKNTGLFGEPMKPVKAPKSRKSDFGW